ncbi:peptide methionine sulfoxide [Diplogelasinospora grovesii]|uniref:peptide-methionine (S)-S-oxide reductase n=1 Tax=Diplogelasinospora grovesii TaxID=303347 RepID=A0AAN6MZI9_9PEZI|nr:peptide methionine sulfoxide [Diplogelasinospora grovesii]
MAGFSTPSVLSRLLRPFTSSTTMGVSPSSSSGAAAPATIPEGAEKATVAAGCFWGVEHMYRKHFGDKGLYDARVGYIGGDTSNPSYKAVCSGNTGHAEATQLVYDPTKITYSQILEFFYKMHDPTTLNQQGPDRGSQYRSGIFYHDAEQEKIAREITKKVNEQWWGGKVVTEILPAAQWWDAEDYHQLYLTKNPYGYECPSHYLRKFPDLK